MKRVIVATLLALAISGCGNEEANNQAQKAEQLKASQLASEQKAEIEAKDLVVKQSADKQLKLLVDEVYRIENAIKIFVRKEDDVLSSIDQLFAKEYLKKDLELVWEINFDSNVIFTKFTVESDYVKNKHHVCKQLSQSEDEKEAAIACYLNQEKLVKTVESPILDLVSGKEALILKKMNLYSF